MALSSRWQLAVPWKHLRVQNCLSETQRHSAVVINPQSERGLISAGMRFACQISAVPWRALLHLWAKPGGDSNRAEELQHPLVTEVAVHPGAGV